MRITVVGCSGSYPGPDSSASCYLLEAEHDDGTGPRTWRIVMDLGSGALGSLQRYADPLVIDAVILSHLHADHCADMSGYHVLRRYHPTGHAAVLPVWGPQDTAGRLARGYDLDPDPGMSEEFDFRTWGAPATIGPFTVEAVPVDHPVESFGLRVTAGGKVLAYSGDTGPCTGLDTVAHEADLFLCEASFRAGDDNPPNLHMSGADAGDTATRVGVRRLVLTHVPPWFDAHVMLTEGTAAYAGPIELAVVGAVYDL